ncbi:MAG: ferritin family protein [Deltaproteobacteria bacterium]|jgi:rubrerythrin|nr:ferritin family protein [Deltaproteobacteria bacterium]
MDILNIAITMEDEGAKFYRSLAEKTDSAAFKSVLNLMANDEDKHQKVFEAWQKKNQVPLEDSTVVSEVNTIFKAANKADFVNAQDQLDLYNQALSKEGEAIEYYEKLKAEPEHAASIELIDKIIKEEKKHQAILTDLIEYISQPDSWIESAEFGVRAAY